MPIIHKKVIIYYYSIQITFDYLFIIKVSVDKAYKPALVEQKWYSLWQTKLKTFQKQVTYLRV